MSVLFLHRKNIIMTSEKIKTVSVKHHLLPVLRFRSRVWDMLCLIIYLKQWFSTRGSFVSEGTLKNPWRHLWSLYLARGGVMLLASSG